ncbi:MAG: VTT domain-containing protein [Candidatus Gracilibacteria bacterium]|nr:VTT domain-containing protein [Candidatus Gracilibacteria bacterium]MDD2908447.1 VTT domain-containing protein [Candidatus Gracilibacteria bacterium]
MGKKLKFIEKHLFELLTVIFWIFLIFLYFHYKNIHNYSNEKIIKDIYFFLKKEGMYGGIMYVSIYAVRTIIFFPSSLLIILSASLFGLPMAIIYTILGENLSSTLGYYLGKFFGKNILSDSLLDKFTYLKKKIKGDSFMSIFLARLMLVPFDPLSYISGFFKAEFGGYFWGTVLGTLPSILIFVFIGAGIQNIENFKFSHIKFDYQYIILSILILSLSLGIVFFLRKRNKKK